MHIDAWQTAGLHGTPRSSLISSTFQRCYARRIRVRSRQTVDRQVPQVLPEWRTIGAPRSDAGAAQVDDQETEGKLRDIVAKCGVTNAKGDGKSLLRHFVESYYKPARVDGRRAATQRSYTQALDYYIVPELGDIPLGEL